MAGRNRRHEPAGVDRRGGKAGSASLAWRPARPRLLLPRTMAEPFDARPPAVPDDPLAALRGEIDALDDALHDLVMRRADVVARLAASRVKGAAASPLRPGREAAILRRLLARHSGPLPPAALVRLWREILGASSAIQGGFAVALPGGIATLAEAARTHFGPMAALRREADPEAALRALSEGAAQAAVLPVPEAEGPGAWWTGLDAARLRVVARLPFFAAGPAPEAVLVSRDAPDPSGDDRSLLRLRFAPGTADGWGAAPSRVASPASATALPASIDGGRAAALQGGLADVLRSAGMEVHALLPHRGSGGPQAVLAEIDGTLAPDDPRLPALRALLPTLAEAQSLGFHATPIRPGADGGE